MNYIEDIIRSGLGETATLMKRDYDLNEWGDRVNEQDDVYEFKTVVDSMDEVENEQEAGDFIEGDIRFFISEECDLEFENGDFIDYGGRRFNITEVRTKTLGEDAFHKEIIAESI